MPWVAKKDMIDDDGNVIKKGANLPDDSSFVKRNRKDFRPDGDAYTELSRKQHKAARIRRERDGKG